MGYGRGDPRSITNLSELSCLSPCDRRPHHFILLLWDIAIHLEGSCGTSEDVTLSGSWAVCGDRTSLHWVRMVERQQRQAIALSKFLSVLLCSLRAYSDTQRRLIQSEHAVFSFSLDAEPICQEFPRGEHTGRTGLRLSFFFFFPFLSFSFFPFETASHVTQVGLEHAWSSKMGLNS